MPGKIRTLTDRRLERQARLAAAVRMRVMDCNVMVFGRASVVEGKVARHSTLRLMI